MIMDDACIATQININEIILSFNYRNSIFIMNSMHHNIVAI